MKRFSEQDRSIEVRLGERFAVELNAMATAGYLWQRADAEDAVALENEDMKAGGGNLGGSSIQRFVFRAERAGSATLRFGYGQPWGTRERELVVQVRIRPA